MIRMMQDASVAARMATSVRRESAARLRPQVLHRRRHRAETVTETNEGAMTCPYFSGETR